MDRRALFTAMLWASLGGVASAQKKTIYTYEKVPDDGKPHDIYATDNNKRAVVRSFRWDKELGEGREVLTLRAVSLLSKRGAKSRFMLFQVRTYPITKPVMGTELMVRLPELSAIGNTLLDARRIVRNWGELGPSSEPESLNFSPIKGVKISIERLAKNDTDSCCFLTIQNGSKTDYYEFNEVNFNRFVDTFDNFKEWLNKQ